MRSFLTAGVVAAVQAKLMSEADFEFIKFVVEHNKSYGTVEEFNARAAIFAETHEEIQRLNNENGTSHHAHNYMSDMTREEYTARLGLKNMAAPETNDMLFHGIPANPNSVPSSVNWETAGKVTPVKDQGSCGSCWAFSTTGSVESAYAIKTGSLVSLSEEQLVECSSSYGNQGCNGGWYYYAWNYLQTYSDEYESAYPYTSSRGTSGSCKYDASKGKVSTNAVKDQVAVQANTSAIKSALAQQPCSVAIQADQRVFQTYSSGVLTSSACGTNIDHAVLAVGYGTENGQEYYLVKNSWGTSWGDQGYIKIGVSSGKGICGINQYVAYPKL